MRPVITFTTDFGPSAPAVCRAVMWRFCPDARIIDISHQVPRYSIRDGAGTLVFALPYMPVGVHVAVVDPGVGTDRLAVGLRTARGDILVGPDNGLLAEAGEALGGIVEARSLENRELMLGTISSSFHGRDVFAPIAGHLAAGVAFDSVGPAVPIERLVRLPELRPTVRDGVLESVVVHVLIFGNLTLAGVPADLEAAVGTLTVGRPLVLEFPATEREPAVVERTVWARTFGDVAVGASLLYPDSEGQLALADNQGDAATRLGLAIGRSVRIRAA
jgi:S-adenosylmethionine hydrolase